MNVELSQHVFRLVKEMWCVCSTDGLTDSQTSAPQRQLEQKTLKVDFYESRADSFAFRTSWQEGKGETIKRSKVEEKEPGESGC